jgi:hypothetical protein
VPARLRSMPVSPWKSSCSDLPASSSRCARVMPTRAFDVPSARSISTCHADDRVLVLADLVALRQIGIEVVLAVEDRAARSARRSPDRTSPPCAPRLGVQHRQHARHSPGRPRRPACSGGAEARWAIRRRSCVLRGELDVDFQPDDRFPFHVLSPPAKAAMGRQRLVQVPVGDLLEAVRDAQQLRFVEVRPMSCRPTGRPSARPPASTAPARRPGWRRSCRCRPGTS